MSGTEQDHPKSTPGELYPSSTFCVSGEDLDFDQITRSLGLTPTRTLRKGELLPDLDQVAQKDSWVYRTPKITRTMDDCIMVLADALRPHAEAIRDIRRRHHVDVTCSILTRHKLGGMCLGPESLRFFVELELPLRIPSYRMTPPMRRITKKDGRAADKVAD